MGVTTSFFIATLDELKAKAPGWVVPEYGPYEVREGIEPFTKRPVTIRSSPLLTEGPAEAPPDELHELVHGKRSHAWKLMGHDLVDLMKLMLRCSDEEADPLRRLALVGPPGAESWVFEVPTPFVEVLAELSAERVAAVAERWAKKLEWEHPPTAIVTQLVEVAGEAVAAKKQMYTYVSL